MSIPKLQAPPRIIHFSFKHLLIKCFSEKINFQRCVLGRGWTWPLWTSLDLSYGFYSISFSDISCRWIYPQSNPTISLPDWFVRLTSLSPRWTGARNPSRRLSQRLALLLVSDADHHPHLEPGPDYKDHEDCGDGKMTKVQKMIMMLVKTEFERTQK